MRKLNKDELCEFSDLLQFDFPPLKWDVIFPNVLKSMAKPA
jgi:hypothetical protein